MAIVTCVLFQTFFPQSAESANWVDTIQASGPSYWWRFEVTSTNNGVENAGSVPGFDGTFGNDIAHADLGHPSATPELGLAMEFTGPNGGRFTKRYVDFGAPIPELTNLRPPTVNKSTTVEYWIKTTHRGTQGSKPWNSPAILGHESPEEGDIFWGWFNEFGNFSFSTSHYKELYDLRDGDGSVTVADGNWHHVVLIKTWDPVGTSMSTMIVDGGYQGDGITESRPTPGGNISYQDADAQIRFLGFTESGHLDNLQYIGMIDEVVIFNRAITEPEARAHYYSAFPDLDADGLPDRYEFNHGMTIGMDDSAGDLDLDGLTNLEEYQLGTDPENADTDMDGIQDGHETDTGVWAGPFDTGTDPKNPDTDEDGYLDGQENNSRILIGIDSPGTSPLLADTDGDGTTDHAEAVYGTDPTIFSVTPQLAPVYVAASNLWHWEISDIQVVWDHGAGIRDETDVGTRSIFSIETFNSSALFSPTLKINGHYKEGSLTWFFNSTTDSILTSWVRRTGPVGDQTALFGFSGKGRRDVSDRLRIRVIASQEPNPSSEWALNFELWNLDEGLLIASGGDTGAVVSSISSGTAVWVGRNDMPGEVNLEGHQGVKVWVTPQPLGLHDTDNDSMDDAWEISWFGDFAQTIDSDWDRDGVLDSDEFLVGSNPLLQDSDGDGALDRYELDQGSDPNDGASLPPYFTNAPSGQGEDLNGNGLSDVWESWVGTFSLSSTGDEDGDGFDNGQESVAGTNPFDPESVLAVDALFIAPFLILNWDVVAYKRYTLEGSRDFAPWNLLIGPVRYTSPVDPQIALFPTSDTQHYRIKVADGDTDSDGVSDWSELLLGSTIEGTDLTASRNSLRQPVQTDTGETLHGDYVAMIDRLSKTTESSGSGGGGKPSTSAPSSTESARLLTQATFGPTMDDIATVQKMGIEAWIVDQLAKPPTLFEPYMIDIWNDFLGSQRDPYYTRPEAGEFLFGKNFGTPFMRAATWGEDQLRQRMAFALSQILVVSRKDPELAQIPRALANYYDIFVRNAFGNYEDILFEIAMHPCMGRFLSHIGNEKADPAIPRYPDENFAREIMQLFTIGLWELKPDGTRILDGGEPIPTYGNREVTEFARVFTGLWFPRRARTKIAFDEFDYAFPMEMHWDRHDFDEKILFLDRNLPGRPELRLPARTPSAENGLQDIRDTINVLFWHPNTGPFICRMLIQFLITSNPSSGYVQRVQDVFANNGLGVRGDLGAVVKAILLDQEARSTPFGSDATIYGKLKEPVLRVTALARAFDLGRHKNLVYWGHDDFMNVTMQEVSLSPGVFNFFRPDYQDPSLMESGLVGPVFQITDSYTSISMPNHLWSLLTEGFKSGPWEFELDFTEEIVVAANPAALVDRMNLLFCAGSMSSETRAEVIQAVENVAPETPGSRVTLAAYLAMCSPDGAIQR